MCARYCDLDIERIICWEEVSPWKLGADLVCAIVLVINTLLFSL